MKNLSIIADLVENNPDDTKLGFVVREHFHKLENNSNTFVICIHCGTWQPPTRYYCKYCKSILDEHD